MRTFQKSPHIAIAASALLTLSACGSEASDEAAPAAEAPAEIAERQDNFEAIKDNFMVIRANFEEGAETDLAAVEAAARDISDRAGRIDQYFPEGSGIDAGWDTEALASIWEQPAEFTAAHEKLVAESTTLATLASEGDVAAVGEQVGALGMSCKNCHDNFRVPQD